MATEAAVSKPRKVAEVRCRPCQQGRHLPDAAGKGGCQFRACRCFCVHEFGPARDFFRQRGHHQDDPGLAELFVALREHGCRVRATKDRGLPYLLWRPKPSSYPVALRGAMAEHLAALAYLLVPESRTDSLRAHWTTGVVGQCAFCYAICCIYDPLGTCRHSWCGWLGYAT